MIHSFISKINYVYYLSQNQYKVPRQNIPPKPILNPRNIGGKYPSLKIGSQQMLGISPILAPFFPPTKPTPPQVVGLREQPLSNKALIAYNRLMRERCVMNRSQEKIIVDKSPENAMIFNQDPVVYRFNPLQLPQPNSYARREFLSQLSRGDIFRYHLLGNVFRQYLPTLLIGFHTWQFLVAPDLCMTTYEIFDLINPFSSTSTSAGVLDMVDIGASSSSGAVDGERAAKVLIPQSVEENLSNDAAVAVEDGGKGKLAIYISGMLLAISIITFKLVVTKTQC